MFNKEEFRQSWRIALLDRNPFNQYSSHSPDTFLSKMPSQSEENNHFCLEIPMVDPKVYHLLIKGGDRIVRTTCSLNSMLKADVEKKANGHVD